MAREALELLGANWTTIGHEAAQKVEAADRGGEGRAGEATEHSEPAESRDAS
jgi:hypothetical protein